MTDLIVMIWIALMVTVSGVGMYNGYSLIGTQFVLMLLGVASISISSMIYS